MSGAEPVSRGTSVEVGFRNRPDRPPAGGASGNPSSDPEQPPGGGPTPADRGGLPSQGQEHRLGGVLGGVVVVEHPPTDAQHQSGVTPDQQLERSGVPVGGEPVQQLGVGRPIGPVSEGGEAGGGVHHPSSYPFSSRPGHPAYTNLKKRPRPPAPCGFVVYGKLGRREARP
jgi:hypothetical protein